VSILLDRPRRANTTAPNLFDLLPVVLGLRETLARHGRITLQVADLPDLWGAAHFPTYTIALAADIPGQEWRPTLVHELAHVLRGPFRDVDAEETAIERLVADVENLLTAGGAR
jgi:hypothetical protein